MAFLRAVPELFPTLTRFLELLFLHESLAPNPICDGVYLTSSPAGISNPFGRGKRIETGPDPRRNHLIAATAAASLVLAYFVLAYRAQWAQWSAAAHAWERYQPAQSDAEGERDAREAISEFGYRRRRLAQRFPDFFGRAAERTRNRLSERIREELLVPRLMQVALKGTTQEGSMPLPQRRSLYYLGLIHSDSADRLRILEPKRLAIWSSMTELEPDIISDYVKSTDAAHRRPVSLDFGLRELDPRDDTGPWRAIISGAQNAIEAGVIRPEELRNLQGRAGDLIEALERFDHDDVTKTILHQLDVGAGQGQGRQLQLRDAYSPKFDAFLRSIEASDFLAQREQLRLLLRSIRGTGIEETGAPLLRPLLDRLSLLYRGREAAPTEPAITVRLDGEQLVFDIDRWSILIRDSRASEQIGQFVRARAGERSIFFSEEMDAQLRPVVWNPANLGNSLFIGKGTIEGRYTRTAFEAHVGDAIARLSGLLSTAPLPEEDARALKEHVREHLLRYAAEYRAQLLRFYRSFSLHAQSQEALRVVLAQIVSEQSPLRDFLTAFERNTKLELSDPMLEPMREAVAEFAPLHTILDTENGAPEFSKYTAILGQMLADLGQPSEAMQAAFEPNLSNPGSLETALSASGRLELANLRNDGGSYRNLVTEWLDSVRLPEYQRSPFLAPFEQLANIGRRDIERSVSRVWERDMKPDWQRLSGKFPFDPDATDEAVPKDITGLLHPEAGKLFDLFRRYVEPISEIASGAPFRERRTLRGKLDLPSDMYPTLNTAAAVSARLWDSAGKAKPLELKFATVPFEHGPNPSSALTLVYLNAGDASVFNFNQKPGIITVRLDWTKEQTSQVGVQLTDLDSKENQFPQPTVVEGSFWSLLRLLKKAEALPVKQPANAVLYSWAIRHRRDGIEKTNARFVLLGDPWEALGQARSGPGRGPSSGTVD